MKGDGVEAEKMSVQAMRTRKKVLGLEHEDTLWSVALVADVYMLKGRWEEAKELRLQVREARKKKLRSEHPSTLTSMGNLASTFWVEGGGRTVCASDRDEKEGTWERPFRHADQHEQSRIYVKGPRLQRRGFFTYGKMLLASKTRP